MKKQTENNMGLSKTQLLSLYERMLLLRRFELTVQKHYRAGVVPGFIHLYVGEEATAVGVCAQLDQSDWITSTHRGHGHALAKGLPPKTVLAELCGRQDGCCGGRGGTMHLYAPAVGLFGTNGIVAGGMPLAAGLGLSAKVRDSGQVAVCFFGDGAVNHGAFHESINLAAVQDLPVVFVCENNLYATCTALADSTKNADVAGKAAAYGIPGVAVDGNDVLAVRQAAAEAVERARQGQGPTLIESRTYRVVGHHEGDVLTGTYRTEEELEQWKKRCPIMNYQQHLLKTGTADNADLEEIAQRVENIIEEAVQFALASPQPDPATATKHVWAEPINPPEALATSSTETVEQGWMEAVRDGIAEEMRRDPHIIYLGEGIGERGGTFGHTKDLWQEFGAGRVIDTPICELGFTGAAISASASGCRAVADLMISDLLFEAGSQIVDQAAKLRYMSNGQLSVPMIIRSGAGFVKNTGPHHSGMFHPVWAHVPGLIVAVPSNPADAKGLFKTALRCGDPVIYHEHKSLLSTKGQVPVGEHFVPFGKAKIVRPGADITIVSCGLSLHHCLAAAKQLDQQGIDCEVIDLRTLVPLDRNTIMTSLAKTNHLLVVDEGFAMCGVGAEIAAAVMEEGFDYLDAPVARLHTDTVTPPFSPNLEAAIVLNSEKIKTAVREVLAGIARAPRSARGASSSASNSTAEAEIKSQGSDKGPKSANPATPKVTSQAEGEPFLMPNMDLTVTEATIVRWVKKVGDKVAADEPVLEVETDKATVDVEAPMAGTLVEILAQEGDVVPLGGRIGTIRR
ncbi:MAG: hypothetical protein JW936_09015 [Sedimentisphaerales bacterium]|nr:hypothetical protein [Sedimentisphaerales bacterium]